MSKILKTNCNNKLQQLSKFQICNSLVYDGNLNLSYSKHSKSTNGNLLTTLLKIGFRNSIDMLPKMCNETGNPFMYILKNSNVKEII